MTQVVRRLLLMNLVKFGTYYNNKNHKLKGEKNEKKSGTQKVHLMQNKILVIRKNGMD